MLTETIRKLLYTRAWDTRCRNTDVARILKPLLMPDSNILDVGCGEYGLARFVSAGNVVGVDIAFPNICPEEFTFLCGSIVSLPFSERSFSVAASVDALEHLPAEIRTDAINELVRVADKGIVITFPCGQRAREIDESFNKELVESNRPVPDWLTEHLENQYPEVESVLSAIKSEAHERGRSVKTTIFFSESLTVAKFLRWSAARSNSLYLICNFVMGLLQPVFPGANKSNAYRSIVLVEFENS